MNNQNHSADLVSIRQIARAVNNENLDEEILVFDDENLTNNGDVFPIRIDALLIALCTNGDGKIGIDLKEYDVKKGSMIVIQPKNYIYLSKFSLISDVR